MIKTWRAATRHPGRAFSGSALSAWTEALGDETFFINARFVFTFAALMTPYKRFGSGKTALITPLDHIKYALWIMGVFMSLPFCGFFNLKAARRVAACLMVPSL